MNKKALWFFITLMLSIIAPTTICAWRGRGWGGGFSFGYGWRRPFIGAYWGNPWFYGGYPYYGYYPRYRRVYYRPRRKTRVVYRRNKPQRIVVRKPTIRNSQVAERTSSVLPTLPRPTEHEARTRATQPVDNEDEV